MIKAGSSFLFLLIRVLNSIYGLSSLALIALSIQLWRELKQFTIVEIVFLGLGLFQLFLVLLVFSAKKSVARLRIYLFLNFLLFIGELTCVIIVFATGDGIIRDITKDQASIDQLKKHLLIVNYFCVGSLGLMLVQMAFTKCYIGSLRENNQAFDYKFLDEEGNKMSLQEKKEKDKQKISQKYSQKRQEYMQKHPSYRAYKQRENSN